MADFDRGYAHRVELFPLGVKTGYALVEQKISAYPLEADICERRRTYHRATRHRALPGPNRHQGLLPNTLVASPRPERQHRSANSLRVSFRKPATKASGAFPPSSFRACELVESAREMGE